MAKKGFLILFFSVICRLLRVVILAQMNFLMVSLFPIGRRPMRSWILLDLRNQLFVVSNLTCSPCSGTSSAPCLGGLVSSLIYLLIGVMKSALTKFLVLHTYKLLFSGRPSPGGLKQQEGLLLNVLVSLLAFRSGRPHQRRPLLGGTVLVFKMQDLLDLRLVEVDLSCCC